MRSRCCGFSCTSLCRARRRRCSSARMSWRACCWWRTRGCPPTSSMRSWRRSRGERTSQVRSARVLVSLWGRIHALRAVTEACFSRLVLLRAHAAAGEHHHVLDAVALKVRSRRAGRAWGRRGHEGAARVHKQVGAGVVRADAPTPKAQVRWLRDGRHVITTGRYIARTAARTRRGAGACGNFQRARRGGRAGEERCGAVRCCRVRRGGWHPRSIVGRGRFGE